MRAPLTTVLAIALASGGAHAATGSAPRRQLGGSSAAARPIIPNSVAASSTAASAAASAAAPRRQLGSSSAAAAPASRTAPSAARPSGARKLGASSAAARRDDRVASVARSAASAASASAPGTGGYGKRVSEEEPTAILILADHSGSMMAAYGTTGLSRAEAVAKAVNGTLRNVVKMAQRGARIMNVAHVGVLGAADLTTYPALEGALASHELVPAQELADNARMVSRSTAARGGAPRNPATRLATMLLGTGADEAPEASEAGEGDVPIWVSPVIRSANGDVQAFQRAGQILRAFTKKHPNSFPPTLINITDGYAVDGDPTPFAEDIRNNVGTSDGKALVYNIHVGDGNNPIIFPSSPDGLPNAEAVKLFHMSSVLPPAIVAAAKKAGYDVKEGARGFAYDADLPVLLKFLDVGSQAASLR